MNRSKIVLLFLVQASVFFAVDYIAPFWGLLPQATYAITICIKLLTIGIIFNFIF